MHEYTYIARCKDHLVSFENVIVMHILRVVEISEIEYIVNEIMES